MIALEQRLRSGQDSWRDGRGAGAGYALAGVGLGWGVGFGLGPSLPAGAVATWLVVAGRALGDEAQAIGARLSNDDLDGPGDACRRWSGAIPRASTARVWPGPSSSRWREHGRRRGGAGLLGGSRWSPRRRLVPAVNTLDAMVGHRNERYARFGWAAARLDDAANWIPARLTALLVAAVRPRHAREVLAALAHPPPHPSPNAGVAEAAFAAALGLRLGGDTVYGGRVDPRPAFGSGRPPEPPTSTPPSASPAT